ncbi:MAG: MBL fold metallo-hydrolase [Winogradskyella sp.]|uniref:MBL fold metallo-hydrolase n=1 Tax=Winogradskyella sp. TaxID=1883156 RepID=UPI0018546A7E|nr:MBL fold metallo-hydrolase [Winogradskyella sp.]
MKNFTHSFTIIILLMIFSCKNDSTINTTREETAKTEVKTRINTAFEVIPIQHGTLIIEANSEVIYVDPTGGADAFSDQKNPSLVLITDIHGDHLNIETLEALNLNSATLIAPKAVIKKIPNTISTTLITLNNGENKQFNSIQIEAIPMYNLREEALKFHPKGRGNGYVLNINNERIYISGDTEDIPEMRNLKNIDMAFVCMNLPYTMPVENAANAVLDFKPSLVYPYHYRGTEGFSDISKFKSLVNDKNDSIEVVFLDWY